MADTIKKFVKFNSRYDHPYAVVRETTKFIYMEGGRSVHKGATNYCIWTEQQVTEYFNEKARIRSLEEERGRIYKLAEAKIKAWREVSRLVADVNLSHPKAEEVIAEANRLVEILMHTVEEKHD